MAEGLARAALFRCSEPSLGAEDHVPDALAADCVVETTTPGVMGSGRSSAIGFQQLVDGEPTDVHVAYVHVREVTVSPGGQATRSPASGTTARHSTPTCTSAHFAAT